MNEKMDFAEEFRKYWKTKGRYLSENNATRTEKNICGWLSGCSSVGDIDRHVIKMKARRESTRRIIVDFLAYERFKRG